MGSSVPEVVSWRWAEMLRGIMNACMGFGQRMGSLRNPVKATKWNDALPSLSSSFSSAMFHVNWTLIVISRHWHIQTQEFTLGTKDEKVFCILEYRKTYQFLFFKKSNVREMLHQMSNIRISLYAKLALLTGSLLANLFHFITTKEVILR